MIMAAPVKQQRRNSTAAQRLATVGCGLLVAYAAASSAQTNVPVAAASSASAAPAAARQTNTVSQAAAALPSTNVVSLIDTIQADSAFQSYTNLLEHSLFVPASEIGGGSGGASDLGPSFAGGLRVTGFWKHGDVIEASLEDRNEPDKKMFVKMGDMVGDTEVKVVGFDLRGRAVLLKKGDEEGRLEYESEAMSAPTTGKPGAPGMPPAPGQPGTAMMQRPGMPPTPPQPGLPPGSRTGAFPSRTPPQAVTAGGSGDSNRQVSRKEQREQTITRLRQMMQSTADPAAKQRLQNYIQMLEKANSQE